MILLWLLCLNAISAFQTVFTYNAHKYSLQSRHCITFADHDSKADSELLNVLLIVEPTPFSYVSGYANRFKETLKCLHSQGCNVQIVTTDNSINAPAQFLSYPITTLRGCPLPMYKAVTISLDPLLNIPMMISKTRPDLIHVSSPSTLCVLAIFWARLFEIPLLVSYHTDIESYAQTYFSFNWISKILRAFIKFVHNKADLILCTSPQLKKRMIGYGVANTDIWRKGVNTDVFSPKYRDESMRMKLSAGNPASPLLLYMGRLGLEKKLTRLKTVLEKIPQARLAIVGQGPEEKFLKEYFKTLPVFFAGELTGEDLSRALASCDIFVMPSDTETLGFSVIEALASGIPAVGVEAGGLIDIIQNNHTGFLAANNEDMLEFSKCVQVLIDDPARRKRFGENGNVWAHQWSWETATKELLNTHYRNAISSHQQRKSGKTQYDDILDQLLNSDE